VKNIHELSTLRADSSMDEELSVSTIDRLRSLLADTSGVLVPGHDVGLALADGEVRRVRPQQAVIGYFADGSSGEQDRSIG
jgi:hypothetical protein